MKHILLIATATALLVTPTLTAQEIWSKDFMEWTPKEITKILHDSPWAAQFSTRPVGQGSPNGLNALAQVQEFTVAWQSATPVKQAVARLVAGDGQPTEEALQYIRQDDPYYVVSITSQKTTFGPLSEDPQELLRHATLEVRGQDVLSAVDVQMQSDEFTATLIYSFPRTTEITVDDKDIEFRFQMIRRRPPRPEGAAAPPSRGRGGRGPGGPPAPLDVKYKFKLNRMLYDGTLEL